MADKYTPYQLGTAYGATTQIGQVPQFGLNLDLASADWDSPEQFAQWARDTANITNAQLVSAAEFKAQQEFMTLHAEELERAKNFQERGLFMLDREFMISKEDIPTSPTDEVDPFFAADTLMTGVNMAESAIGSSFDRLTTGTGSNLLRGVPVVGGWLDFLGSEEEDVDEEDLYSTYKKKGGLLTESEFDQFNLDTRRELVFNVKGAANLGTILGLPVIGQTVAATVAAYRAATTAGIMAAGTTDPSEGLFDKTLGRAIDPSWLSGDAWHRAWRASEDRSLGNAIIDGALTPFKTEDQLVEWRKSNSLYQLSSLGSELAVGWYTDPLVIAGKVSGNTARVLRHELPLNVQSRTYMGAVQAMRDEPVTQGLISPYARWRGEQAAKGWDGLTELAKVMPLSEYGRLTPFLKRSVDGQGLAQALHFAVRNDDLVDGVSLVDMTKRMAIGDPKAWEFFRSMKEDSPASLSKYAPGAQTFIDAIEATKTRSVALEKELADLDNIPIKSPFHNWTVQRRIEDKQKDLAEVTSELEKAQGYASWQRNIGTTFGVRINQIHAPKLKTWSIARQTNADGDVAHLFRDSQFGAAHSFRRIGRGAVIQKANMTSLHDTDMGVMSIQRTFDQLGQLAHYVNPDAREAAIQAWHRAETPMDRYKVLYDMEFTHVADAFAAELGVSPDIVNSVIHKIVDEKNSMVRGLLHDSTYTTYPMGGRLGAEGEQTLKLVEKSEDGEMTRIQIMENGRHLQTFEIPTVSLYETKVPGDPTQTANYYQPLDHRRLFYALKHNREMMEVIDGSVPGSIADRQAWLMETIDTWGTNFNSVWKPLQLFRLGWPQRVLMDETLRGLAVIGPMKWTKYYGGDFARASVNASTRLTVRSGAARRLLGDRDAAPLGPSPHKANPNPFIEDAQVLAAPRLPEDIIADIVGMSRQSRKVREGRLAKMGQRNRMWWAWSNNTKKIQAWQRDLDNQGLSDEFLARAARHGITVSNGRVANQIGKDPFHPIKQLREDWSIDFLNTQDFAGRGHTQGAPDAVRPQRVYDPITGKETRRGFVVSLPSTRMAKTIGDSDIPTRDLEVWYQDNLENLSYNGMRMVVDGDGNLMIGRWFPSNQRRAAEEMARHVYASNPEMTLTDLTRGFDYYVADANYLSPVMEHALHREWTPDPVMKENFSEPDLMTGPKATSRTLYHGSGEGLPDELLPRNEVYPLNGALMGRGFNTTIDSTLADRFGVGGVYVVRNVRNGKPVKTWNADNTITPTQAQEFLEFLQTYRWPEAAVGQSEEIRQYLTARFSNLDDAEMWTSRVSEAVDGPNWTNAFGEMVYMGWDAYGAFPITAFLEQKYGVGVLTHKLRIPGRQHKQAYVWLKPEDLEVLPRFEKTGKYRPLAQWLAHPMSVENPVPENRILRVGEKQVERLALPGSTRVDRVRGDLRAQEVAVDEITELDIADFDLTIDSVQDRVYRAMQKRFESGKGYAVYKSADGKKVNFPRAFEDKPGELFFSLASVGKTVDALADSHSVALSMMRQQGLGHIPINPPEFTKAALTKGTPEYQRATNYYRSWADLLNNQVAYSPIWSRMLKGQSNDDIIKWLQTDAGAQARREAMPEHWSPEMWVDQHRYELNKYLPSGPLRRQLRDTGRVEPSDLRKHVYDDQRPTVHGPDIEVLDKRTTFGRWLGNLRDHVWHALGTVPIDTLSRHPFARAMYDAKVRSEVKMLDSKWITPQMIEDIQKSAHKFAMDQVRKTLWDLTDATNFTDALRFMAPFWGAQQEAITKWGKIVVDRPETLGRFFMGQNAVYQNFMVVDEEGNVVDRKGPQYHPSDRVVFNVPSFMRHGPLGKALKTVGSVGVPVSSANTVLQGEMPLLPGAGPIITIPAHVFLNHVNEVAGVNYDEAFLYRWLFPIGRPQGGDFAGVLDQILPGWAKRVAQFSQGEDGMANANLFVQVGREMEAEATERGLKPGDPGWPTQYDVQRQVRWVKGLRIITGLMAPVQMQYRPHGQFFVDEAHRYRQQYGPDGFDRFIEDYGPTMARYMVSSSNSTVGIPPTAQGMEEYAANKKMIAQFPEWGGAIISPEAYEQPFSWDAYVAQFRLNLGPGDSTTLRESLSPKERYERIDTQTGWWEWRKFNAALNDELISRGITTLGNNGSEDLVLLKEAFVKDLTARYPAWRDDYDNFTNDIDTRVASLSEWVGNKRFDTRSDILGVRQYLLIRQATVEQLENYHSVGGSRSLQATSDPYIASLNQWFYGEVQGLIEANPAFAEFYARYLTSDTLERGGAGF